jgi:hypothetical protein
MRTGQVAGSQASSGSLRLKRERAQPDRLPRPGLSRPTLLTIAVVLSACTVFAYLRCSAITPRTKDASACLGRDNMYPISMALFIEPQ